MNTNITTALILKGLNVPNIHIYLFVQINNKEYSIFLQSKNAVGF